MIFGVCIGVSGIAMWLSFVKGGLARFVEIINNPLILLSLVEKVPEQYHPTNQQTPFSSPRPTQRVRFHQKTAVHIVNTSYNLNYLIFIDLNEDYTFMRRKCKYI